MEILVTGASGFVGSMLIPRLAQEGHTVRALARDPRRLTPQTAKLAEAIVGDVLTGAGLAEACAGVDVAYYLIHSMERPRAGAQPSVERPRAGAQPSVERPRAGAQPSAAGAVHAGAGFPERERIGAERFALAAAAAKVDRIVYLGGPHPPAHAASRHLGSRELVQRTLMEAVPGSVALRASIVIGARSRSFRLLVRLIERMPVLALPAWRDYRTQPIDARDLIEILLKAASEAKAGGLTLDVAGPDALTYAEMLRRIAEIMLIDRPELPLGVSVTAVTARVAAAIAQEDPELVLALMEGLAGDLLGADDRAAELLEVPLHSFDAAVEHALAEWERVEPLAAR